MKKKFNPTPKSSGQMVILKKKLHPPVRLKKKQKTKQNPSSIWGVKKKKNFSAFCDEKKKILPDLNFHVPPPENQMVCPLAQNISMKY